MDVVEGVCITDGSNLHSKGDNKGIFVRSIAIDGNVLVDFGVLLHEIGHAFDYGVASFAHGGNSNTPFHMSSSSTSYSQRGNNTAADYDMDTAFREEHKQFPDSYFHTQPEFFAEVFARYCLDRSRTFKVFPKTTIILDNILKAKGVLSSPESQSIVDSKLLADAHAYMMPPPPVTTLPDCWDDIKTQDKMNDAIAGIGRERDIFAICLITEDEIAARVASRDVARRRFNTKSTGTSPYSVNDAFHAIDVNDSSLHDNLLTHHFTNHSLVLLGKAKDVSSTSGGILDILRFAERTRDLAVPVFYGTIEELRGIQSMSFRGSNNNTRIVWKMCEVKSFTREQVQTQLLRDAFADGFLISEQAKSLLLEKIERLNLSFGQIDKIWKEIRTYQRDRATSLCVEKKLSEKHLVNVLMSDIDRALKKFARNQESDPLEDLDAMIGLKEVKTKVRQIVQSIEAKTRMLRIGREVEMPRLYILFLGNPGTGKTKVSDIFRRILQKIGFVKNSKYREIGAMDIKNANELETIFNENKDGIIFIDEFHRMAEDQERQKALKWMVPQLTSPEFARTVIIGAGYTEEITKMLTNQDIDPGLDSRFDINNRIMFEDYSRDEIGQILRMHTNKKDLTLEQDVFDEALRTIMRRQRAMYNPSNGRAVEKFLESASEKQESRVTESSSNMNDDEFEREMSKLALSDVQETSRVSIQDFWEMFDRDYSYLPDLREKLEGIEGNIMRLRDLGGDDAPLENYNFILSGSTGTGKTTLVKEVFGKFFCALDVIPYSDVVVVGGTDLQASYVGQTTPKVHEKFRQAWGKVIFIDEVSGFVNSGFKDDIKKAMLPYLEQKGKLIAIVADYKDNIAKFLALDEGMPGRFNYEYEVKNWSVERSVDVFMKVCREQQRISLQEHHKLYLLSNLRIICDHSKFKNGRTICDQLVSKFGNFYSLGYKKQDISPDDKIQQSLEKAIDHVYQELENERGAAETAARNLHSASVFPRVEVQASQAQEATHTDEKDDAKDDSKMSKYERAIAKVDQMPIFKDKYNNDPEALKRDAEDENSDYNKALGQELGIASKKAKKVRMKVAKIVKEKVTKISTEQIQRFVYHCPFCGRIDSPSCAYIGESMPWKLEKSLKKPWTEEIVTEIEEEVEREVIVEEDI